MKSGAPYTVTIDVSIVKLIRGPLPRTRVGQVWSRLVFFRKIGGVAARAENKPGYLTVFKQDFPSKGGPEPNVSRNVCRDMRQVEWWGTWAIAVREGWRWPGTAVTPESVSEAG